MKDLRERFAKIEIQASEPIVPFRETISSSPNISLNDPNENDFPNGTVMVSVADKSCTLQIRCLPLPPIVRKFLLDSMEKIISLTQNEFNSESNMSFIEELKEKFQEAYKLGQNVLKIDWESLLPNIVSFGPKKNGSNMLINNVPKCGWKKFIILN